LQGILAVNAFGDAYEDLAIQELRADAGGSIQAHERFVDSAGGRDDGSGHGGGTGPKGDRCSAADGDVETQLRGAARSHVGVWPHFSLLNHACLPNCVHYVVGSSMVVRAVQPVAAGGELSVSYLGAYVKGVYDKGISGASHDARAPECGPTGGWEAEISS
jgi:hypothetical protein